MKDVYLGARVLGSGEMIKAGKELLRLQEENQKLGAKIYALSSQIISLEQDKIELREKLSRIEKALNKQIADIDEQDLCLNPFEQEIWDIFNGNCEGKFTPHFIDAEEIDVKKFKAEMSKVRLQVHPIEKEDVYDGCHNCYYQPKPLMACEWLYQQTTIFVKCPRWKARIMPPKERE